jgi:hypothetical protein
MRLKFMRSFLLIVAAALLSACVQPQSEITLSKKGAVELRAIQSRAFDTDDRNRVFRGIIATFQDLGYSILKVEPEAGTVTANKRAALMMTATAYPRDKVRMIVRANAILTLGQQVPGHQVDSPEFYQQRFFEPLSKAIFLQALQIEDADTDAVRKAEENIKNAEERAKVEEEQRQKKIEEEQKKQAQQDENDPSQ